MAKSLTEIAQLLDEAQDALELMARQLTGPEAQAELYAQDGTLIDLRSLAVDLRETAAGSST